MFTYRRNPPIWEIVCDWQVVGTINDANPGEWRVCWYDLVVGHPLRSVPYATKREAYNAILAREPEWQAILRALEEQRKAYRDRK